MAKQNKPAIRFKGFTDAWEQRKLGKVVKEVTRNDPTSEAPIMMITANNGFIEQSERYAFDNAGESLKKYILLQKGELAYNHGASKLRPFGSCFALTTAESARIPFVYHCFSAENQNAEFLSIELNGSEVESQLRKIVSSGARMDGLLNISFDEYSTVTVLLPDIKEQEHIADFFRNLDHLITLHQRKYDKLQVLKKAMLEKMFPKNGSSVPEIRFKGFTDAWEQRKCKDVAPLQRGFDLPTSQMVEGKFPVVMSNGVGGYHNEYKVKGPGVITGRSGTIGKLQYIESDYWPHNTSLWVTNFKDNYPKFIFYLYQNLDLSKFGTGSGVPTLNRNDVHDTLVCVPDFDEQKKISAYFDCLDNLITLHQRELEKLQNIKKSMLEKMFV